MFGVYIKFSHGSTLNILLDEQGCHDFMQRQEGFFVYKYSEVKTILINLNNIDAADIVEMPKEAPEKNQGEEP